MAFDKKTWQNRISQYPNRRKIKNISDNSEIIVDIYREEGTIQTTGDSFSASTMNNLEDRIGSMFPVSIENGGTGKTTAIEARQNLGIDISQTVGSWEPKLSSDGTAPTYTTEYNVGKYYKINNLVYITFHIKGKITNAGTGYAQITGLPFTSQPNMSNQALSLIEFQGGLTQQLTNLYVQDNSKTISIRKSGGSAANQWKVENEFWLGASGCYICV